MIRAFLLAGVVLLSACMGHVRDASQPVWAEKMEGRRVTVTVDDGRVYDCVMVGYAQRQTVVECKEQP